MGSTGRKRHVRASRKSRSAAAAQSKLETLMQSGRPDPNTQNPVPGPEPVNYCSEEQLQEILLKKLDCMYNEAISKLVALGYDEDLVMRTVLKYGHCYGGMDVVTNVVHNSLAHLSGGSSYSADGENCDSGDDEGEVEEGDGDEGLCDRVPSFSDLRQLEAYSLAGMVCLLKQFKPKLSKVDAMWLLLMCDLHVGRASSMELTPYGGGDNVCGKGHVEGGGKGGMGVVGTMQCKICGNGECFANEFFSYSAEVSMQKDGECGKKFSLPPAMKSLLRKNVAAFASGFRANAKNLPTQLPACHCSHCSFSNRVSQAVAGSEVLVNEQTVEAQGSNKLDEVNSVLNKFRDLNLEEKMDSVTDEQKDEMIIRLLQQVKELEEQVKERKEWAQQKALQAAKKLSSDLTELKILKMEREETQRLKKGKQTLDDSTLKRLSEMESALRKASGQVDRANAAVRRLETENAEIRAEMEAAKLSASESTKSCVDASRREKKSMKKILAWEKLKSKLQEEMADEKKKALELQRLVARVKQAQKDAEDKVRHEMKAKELASAQVEEERRLKEAAESNKKRNLEALRLRIEIDFQRHRDDQQRLEQEMSRLNAQVADLQPNALPRGKVEGPNSQNEGRHRLLELAERYDLSKTEGNCDRECIICMQDEVSVVFLPCAHEVICAKCNEKYGRKGRATCPCCRVPIEHRIRVFGASS